MNYMKNVIVFLVLTLGLLGASEKPAHALQLDKPEHNNLEHSHHDKTHTEHWHEFRAVDAHVHGAAEMTLVLDGEQLEMALTIPAVDLLGFEHAPASVQDQQRYIELLINLQRPENQLQLPAAAECELTRATVNSGLEMDNTDQHVDFLVVYHYVCRQPQGLKRLDFPLFTRYASLRHIDVNWIVNDRQGVSQLSRDRRELHF